MPHDGDAVAAMAARIRYAARPPNCRYGVRMSCVFAKKFGRR
ncbi:hypothetical protein BC477_15710 [Clavibacter michiganensis subsp. michiganensis]|uniref:Uncharacterized protein n=1 Tax=Clavibacter michiganensis subsp. michiganensis TaxID=33013 RepID=A0A251XGD3_CLAMM|nr:hypothetical protein BC477_15710 [Clavibacter michiganensis subsp. michiganensis]OUE01253.1 hypothetical protein CMMCAS07_13170 [Clavibacter michiganensis subsp. michiganensis]